METMIIDKTRSYGSREWTGTSDMIQRKNNGEIDGNQLRDKTSNSPGKLYVWTRTVTGQVLGGY